MFARSAVQYALGFAVCQACNTTYCGSFLGQSQDVDLCRMWKNEPLPNTRRCLAAREPMNSATTADDDSDGREVSFDNLPWVQRQGDRRFFVFPQIAGRTRLHPNGASAVPRCALEMRRKFGIFEEVVSQGHDVRQGRERRRPLLCKELLYRPAS